MIGEAMITVSVLSGLGNYMDLLEPPEIIKALEWTWIGQCLLIQSIGFGKYAIIAFLLRIQDRVQSKKTKVSNYVLYFIGVSNFVLNIVSMTMILTSCSPTAKYWNKQLPGSCDHLVRHRNTGYIQSCMKHRFPWPRMSY